MESTTLPDEIWLYILEYLDRPVELLSVSLVDRRFQRLAADETLWRRLCALNQYHRLQRDDHLSYKTLFRHHFVLDRNWANSAHQSSHYTQIDELDSRQTRWVTGFVATGGDAPVLFVAYSDGYLRIYNLTPEVRLVEKLPLKHNVHLLLLYLDKRRCHSLERSDTESSIKSKECESEEPVVPEPRVRLERGVSRGLGTEDLTLVAACGQTIKVWSMDSKTYVKRASIRFDMEGRVRRMCCIDSTSYIISGDDGGNIDLWDIRTGRKIKDVDHLATGVCSFDATPRGEYGIVAAGCDDCTTRIWDLNTDKKHVLQGHKLPVWAVLLEGDYLFTGSFDSTIRVWDLVGNCLALLTSHMSVVYHLGVIRSSSVTSIVSVCHNGLIAVHTIVPTSIENVGQPETTNVASVRHCNDQLTVVSSKARNVSSKVPEYIDGNGRYWIVLHSGGRLSIFRPNPLTVAAIDSSTPPSPKSPLSFTSKAETPQTSVTLVRTIQTRLRLVFQLVVMQTGILLVGLPGIGTEGYTNKDRTAVVRFYDFECRDDV
ncbi:hypothetical protein FRC18_005988 [Serendipita sp. 400]|nr:hypothetical protein FRC18_005988 [Serendipita sp. 400]